MRTVARQEIAHFCQLVQRGMDAWMEAGKLLCALKRENPNICEAILKYEPRLTPQILRTFERLGSGEIYAPLLVDGSMGARRLLMLPYDEQVRLHNATIPVARAVFGDFMVEQKTVAEMTEQQAKLAFTDQGVRPVKEQMQLLRPISVRARSGKPAAERTESLDTDPNETVSGKLAEAQAALLRARELMSEQKIDSPLMDKHYTAALNALGNLRFELSELKEDA